MGIIVSTILQGLLWGLMAIGVFLTFRVLDMPDMTAEGSFPLGAAVCVTLIRSGVHPLIAALVGGFSGMLAGAMTALLITKCGLPALLAGILTMTGLYSINLRILGRANLSLNGYQKMDNLLDSFHFPPYFNMLFIAVAIIGVIVILLALLFKTEAGQALIATGDNEQMARSMAINTDLMKIYMLMLSNGLIALAGAFIAQDSGYADISSGIGTIVIGLASVIIGEVIFGRVSLTYRFICVILGSIIYRFILMLVIRLGLNPNDLKLISAILLAICLALPQLRMKLKQLVFLKKEV
ncbi:ABC transporter permease [Isobaculum melis]|uniref:Putative ABC transport system permease protein n=1 Tax=Isobaculum melis TaxID=142588 RepID=A0A1H9T0B5_9LACT|nr:branched-chain amino acid ABC transporter permease [Isobaculum melis]SER90588.1 putative ABC transport system permease protein [Isobaculum melis]